MGGRRFLAATLVLGVLFTAAAEGQDARFTESQPIGIDAEQISYDKKANTIVARGAVVIKRGESELHADEVSLNRTTNVADARGHVLLTDPEGSVVADAMQLDLDEETGWLTRAEVTSPRYRYSLWGDRIEKGLGQSYHIENGRFTSCQCDSGPPTWSLSGEDFRVDLNGYGKIKGGTFNLLDTPILYLPQAIIPVQRDRQSGLLLPRFSASNRRGFQTMLPVYWAINKSQDATVAFDAETSARLGGTAEYRYVIGREMRGTLSGSYFNESIRGADASSAGAPLDRWSLATDQIQKIGENGQAYSDVFMVSDNQYVRDINVYTFEYPQRETEVRTLPYTGSRLGLLHLWDRMVLKGEGTYYQDLTGPDSETLQRAPAVEAWGQTLLGDFALAELRTEAVDYQRGSNVSGLRLDVEPVATVPLPLGRFAFGDVQASVRETAYHLTDTAQLNPSASPSPTPAPLTTTTLGRNQSRELFQLHGEIGTAFDRVYPVHWLGLEKLKHTIEPEIQYLYVPSVSQSDLPLFDGTDRVNHRNLLTYGLTTRFIGKFADTAPKADTAEPGTGHDASGAAIRELGRLYLAQSVDISREIAPLHTGQAKDHFSDVDFGGQLNPNRALSLRFLTNYDAGNNTVTAARFGLFLQDPRTRSSEEEQRLDTRTSAAISYRFLTQSLLKEIDANIVLRLTDWAGVQYSSRYDVVTSRFLDNHVGLRLISTCDCWALDFVVTDHSNPQEVEVRAQLTLAGLGSTTQRNRLVATPY